MYIYLLQGLGNGHLSVQGAVMWLSQPLDEVQVGEMIPKQEWTHWDPEIARRARRVPVPSSVNSDTESTARKH